MRAWPGRPAPLGAHFDGAGTNFSVYAGGADRVELCLFEQVAGDRRRSEEHRIEMIERIGGVFHVELPDVRPGARYGYRVHGARRDAGDYWNPAKLLIDPYALALDGAVHWGPSLFDNDLDSARAVPKSVVVGRAFDWGDDRPPDTPWPDTVVYEAHVRGLTVRHPEVEPSLRGTYLGVASEPVIEHLQRLGITAVELLPVHAFVDEERLVEHGLSNYWGYNSIAFLAPHGRYASSPDPEHAVDEFRTMVRRLHRAGIEVILDVVYNHTAESGGGGPILSYRGFDNAGYYRLDPDDRSVYVDYTGCGNSLDMRNPHVLQLIMDSLRYWVTEMHVDGFRFDLASALARELHDVDRLSAFFDLIQQDPVVSRVKLIAEPWDVGEGGYQVGNFPPLWSEWNGRYRDAVRDFWRGNGATLGELAERLSGSSDLYRSDGRSPHASINFVTAHDGFTLADLVAYEHKHNEPNGEGNADGSDDNRSWNCGVEGPTSDQAVLELRARQARNFAATLLLSQGVPMLLAGDELGHTQQGMNNAYAQDNELSWIDWEQGDGDSVFETFRRLTDFRRRHPALRRRRFLDGHRDVTWLAPDGNPMTPESWMAADPPVLVMVLDGNAISEPGRHGERIVDDSILVVVNGGAAAVPLVVPAGEWRVDLDTSLPGADGGARTWRGGSLVDVASRSVIVAVSPATP